MQRGNPADYIDKNSAEIGNGSSTDDNIGVVEESIAQESVLSESLRKTNIPSEQNQTKKKPRLEQLDGFRFLVALWLVVAHNFSPKTSPTGGLLERFCMRRYVAVTFFIVLSGFVSHYAYGNRSFFFYNGSINRETIQKFYIGRVGSVVACYYATMAALVFIRGWAGHFAKEGWWYAVKGSLLSLFFLQTWIPSYAYFGNTPAWTLATLVWHWAAYPWLQPRVKDASSSSLVISLGILPALATLPACLSIALNVGGYLAHPQKVWYALYTIPVFRLTDFAFGIVLCELFQRNEQTIWRHPNWSKWSDLALPAIFGLVLAVPFNKRSNPFDMILMTATTPLFGFLIYMSSCQPRGSMLGYLMSLDVCRRLGDFAFQVYLWRWPLFAMVSFYENGRLRKGWLYLEWWPYFISSTIVLYLLSYLWYRFVDTPIRFHLTASTQLTQGDEGGALSSQLLSDQAKPLPSTAQAARVSSLSSSTTASSSSPSSSDKVEHTIGRHYKMELV